MTYAMICCLFLLICAFPTTEALNTARGQVVKSMDSNSLSILLASNGKSLPELMSWSSALNCVKLGSGADRLNVFEVMNQKASYQCHLLSDYVFTSCPELIKGSDKKASFVLNTDGKIIRKAELSNEALELSALHSSAQRCDNMVQFNFEETAPGTRIPSFSKQVIISLTAVIVAFLLLGVYSIYYKKLKHKVRSRLKKLVKIARRRLKAVVRWIKKFLRKREERNRRKQRFKQEDSDSSNSTSRFDDEGVEFYFQRLP